VFYLTGTKNQGLLACLFILKNKLIIRFSFKKAIAVLQQNLFLRLQKIILLEI